MRGLSHEVQDALARQLGDAVWVLLARRVRQLDLDLLEEALEEGMQVSVLHQGLCGVKPPARASGGSITIKQNMHVNASRHTRQKSWHGAA